VGGDRKEGFRWNRPMETTVWALLADFVLSSEAIMVITGLVVALTSAVVGLFYMLIASHNERLKQMESDRNSYKEIAVEATSALERKVNTERGKLGHPPFDTVAPVVPEHSSPITKKQQDTADLQTLRARLTAAVMALGLPPRDSGQSVEPRGEG